MKTLVHVLTVPESLRFLRGQPAFMREHGFDTHVVCSPGPLLDAFAREEGATAHAIEMRRAITPREDLVALARLTSLLRRLRPDVVHAQTPKGGLLGVLAGRAAGAPRVLYHMRGLPFMGARPPTRWLLVATERIACGAAHAVICHSASLRAVAEDAGVVARGRAIVLGPGGNGVDTERFDPDGATRERALAIRRDLAIPEGAPVIGFVGRLVRDKGIVELREAWTTLRERFPEARLLVVGPFEERDPVPLETRRALETDPRVHLVGATEDVAPYYALMDVLALPTYREGFPNVPLEAAAMRVPVVATRIPGCVDAVRDGETGTLVSAADARALTQAVDRYLADPRLRREHGAAGRHRATSELARERVWLEQSEVYRSRATHSTRTVTRARAATNGAPTPNDRGPPPSRSGP